MQVLEPIAPSAILAGLLADTVPWAIAVGTEKTKSELAKRDHIPNYFDPPCICITNQPESTVNRQQILKINNILQNPRKPIKITGDRFLLT